MPAGAAGEPLVGAAGDPAAAAFAPGVPAVPLAGVVTAQDVEPDLDPPNEPPPTSISLRPNSVSMGHLVGRCLSLEWQAAQ
jgi:hypothetical protein